MVGIAASGFSFAQGGAQGGSPAPDGREWKKGLMLGTFHASEEMSLLEKFQLLTEAGFDGVEPPSGLNREEVIRARDESGLEIPSVVVSTHWAHPLTDPDPAVRERGLEGLKTGLRDAAAYGANTVLLVPGVVNAEVSYDEAYRRSQKEIRKAIPLAEELGISIAIENVWNQFLLSPLEAARYVDEFESPRVGWYFDVGNIMNFGWPNHWIRILGTRIKKVHLKEFSRGKRDSEGLWAGFNVNLLDGDNDWSTIMSALRETGYDGYLIAEPPHRDPDVADDVWLREHIVEKMDTILALGSGA